MRVLPSVIILTLALAAPAEFGCSYEDLAPNGPDSGGASTSGGAGAGGAAGASGSRADVAGSGGASPGKDADAPMDAPTGTGGAAGARPDVAVMDGSDVDGADADGSVPPPERRGATLPYEEYQAEDGDTNGTHIGPSRAFGDPAAEASQRRAVRLDATGQYVRVMSKTIANSIVIRYAIPDKGEGTESWSTLSVYVNGAMRAKLPLTSRWSWTYGDFGNPSPNDPMQGKPHHFYDEARALIGDLPAGATVAVQKDSDDAAAYYIIDLIDLEQVAAPLPQPANSIPITDCGATPDDDSDDGAAIQQCIDRARTQGRSLYIPQGTFRSIAKALSVDNVTIRGAGMWHSIISGFSARFDCYGNGCKYYDFAVSGDTVVRDDKSPESAFSGVTGDGTVLENIWAEHSKTGYWVGPNANNLVIRRSRFRNLYADGINLWKGTSNSIIEQCHFRNTGDDAIASWSPSDGAASVNNVLRFNTIQIPWMANCFGLYGGTAHRVEDNVCEDVVQYPGILLARQFGSLPFAGMTQIVRNSLIRAGGPAYGQEQGAIKFHADEAAMGGFLVRDLTIQEATFSGIHLQGGHRIDNLRFENIAVNAPGTSGIRVNHDANGAAVAHGLVVTRGGLDDQSRGVFTWTREAGNSGW